MAINYKGDICVVLDSQHRTPGNLRAFVQATPRSLRSGRSSDVPISPEIVGDGKNYLVENAQVTVTFVEDKAVTIEMPSSVILKVADAPEGVRGDSANNVQKAIVLETGITVQAPLFIKTGEKIKVDTRTGKYMERA